MVDIGGRDLFVPIRKVAAFEPGRVVFDGQRVDLRRFERRPGELLLARDLLAHHLINFVGGRLIRANEIELAKVNGAWEVVAVDPSSRPVLRRLIPGFRKRKAEPGNIVDWASIEPFVAHVPTSRLRIPYRKLAKLHPAQIADLVEAASHDEGEEIIEAVAADRELEADVFEELDTEHQLEFVRSRSDDEAARLLSSMAPDDAADLITEVDQERRLPILNLLPEPQQRKVRSLLSYNPETAGGLMSPDFLGMPAEPDGGCVHRGRPDQLRPARGTQRGVRRRRGGPSGWVGLDGAADPGRSDGAAAVGHRLRAGAHASRLGPRRHRAHHVRLQSDRRPRAGCRARTRSSVW